MQKQCNTKNLFCQKTIYIDIPFRYMRNRIKISIYTVFLIYRHSISLSELCFKTNLYRYNFLSHKIVYSLELYIRFSIYMAILYCNYKLAISFLKKFKKFFLTPKFLFSFHAQKKMRK